MTSAMSFARTLSDAGAADAAQACAWLATAAYSLMDQGLYDETAALFSEDAVWVRGGVPVSGRAGIRAALDKRPAGDLSRHIVTNVLVQATGADTARASALFLPLRGPLREDGTVALAGFAAVGDLDFEFRREADGWRITRLIPRMVFKA